MRLKSKTKRWNITSVRDVTSKSSSIAYECVGRRECSWSWPLEASAVMDWDGMRSWCKDHHGFFTAHLYWLHVSMLFSNDSHEYDFTGQKKSMLCRSCSLFLPIREDYAALTAAWFRWSIQTNLECEYRETKVWVSVHKSWWEEMVAHQYTSFLEICLVPLLQRSTWPVGSLLSPIRGAQKLNDGIAFQGWAQGWIQNGAAAQPHFTRTQVVWCHQLHTKQEHVQGQVSSEMWLMDKIHLWPRGEGRGVLS